MKERVQLPNTNHISFYSVAKCFQYYNVLASYSLANLIHLIMGSPKSPFNSPICYKKFLLKAKCKSFNNNPDYFSSTKS